MLFRTVIYICSTIVTNILHGNFLKVQFGAWLRIYDTRGAIHFEAFIMDTDLILPNIIQNLNKKKIRKFCLKITKIGNKEVMNIPTTQSVRGKGWNVFFIYRKVIGINQKLLELDNLPTSSDVSSQKVSFYQWARKSRWHDGRWWRCVKLPVLVQLSLVTQSYYRL